MSDSIKSVIKSYIYVQISNFWVSYLERWVIFDLFASVPQKGSKYVVWQKLNTTIKFFIENYVYM